MAARVGILGVGNVLMGDDGVGVHALRRLMRIGLPEGLEPVEAGTDPWTALERAGRWDAAVVADAVRAGGVPGEVYVFSPADLEAGPAPLSLHGVSAVRCLGAVLTDVRTVGMEPASIAPRLGLSPPCAANLDRFARAVLEEALALLSNTRREEKSPC